MTDNNTLVAALEDIYQNVDRWNSLQISSRIRSALHSIEAKPFNSPPTDDNAGEAYRNDANAFLEAVEPFYALSREAPQAVTVEDILQSLREALQHDQGGLDYSKAVGVPISNASELRSEVAFYERAISFIEDRIHALGGRT